MYVRSSFTATLSLNDEDSSECQSCQITLTLTLSCLVAACLRAGHHLCVSTVRVRCLRDSAVRC